MKNNALAIMGALAGAVVGYFVCSWLAGQGFYALMVAGLLVGFGAELGKSRSMAVPVASGVIGLAAGILTEWMQSPFIADASLGYFLANLHQLKWLTLIFIVLGAAAAFWFPLSRLRALRARDAQGDRSATPSR